MENNIQYLQKGACLMLDGTLLIVDELPTKTGAAAIVTTQDGKALFRGYENAPHIYVAQLCGTGNLIKGKSGKVAEAIVLGSMVEDITGK